jgi:hypothetical protein
MNNEHEGQGGSYRIDEDGQRTLVERTKERADAPAEPPADEATQTEPATAGIFSPVAPVDQPATTE